MNMPHEIREVARLDGESEREILDVLEKSLAASHGFFSDGDAEIRVKKARAKDDLRHLVLLGAYAYGEIKGFAGISGEELKMLYVHPDWQGKGMGRNLVHHSIQKYGIAYVDVYAQNERAVGFYTRLGFSYYAKTSKPDSRGKSLPVLRMRLAPHG